MQEYSTGAKRSARMPRYDLIPYDAIRRLAERFTGEMTENGPDGGALKYGEVNWYKGLPTSDVINHIEDHFRHWVDIFRKGLYKHGNDMSAIQKDVQICSELDDHLAGAMWGLCVLMYQEKNGMFHDDLYKTGSPNEKESPKEDYKKIIEGINAEIAQAGIAQEKKLPGFICNGCGREFHNTQPVFAVTYPKMKFHSEACRDTWVAHNG